MLTSFVAARSTLLARARTAWASPPPYAVKRHLAVVRKLGSGALDVFQFGCAFLFTQTFVLTSQQCVGPSMLPTLGVAGDVVLMWPTAGRIARPQLGDVVICASPTDPTLTVCKRVVGMPGDVVRYRWLPGMPPPSASEREAFVPRGQCWLQGDNEWDSTDSRYYGPVPLALVRGVVFFKLWPLTEAGFIGRTKPAPPLPASSKAQWRQRLLQRQLEEHEAEAEEEERERRQRQQQLRQLQPEPQEQREQQQQPPGSLPVSPSPPPTSRPSPVSPQSPQPALLGEGSAEADASAAVEAALARAYRERLVPEVRGPSSC